MDFYISYKEIHKDELTGISTDPNGALLQFDDECKKCVNLLQTAKHAPEQIIDQVLMKNFCLLKELTADEPKIV